MNRSVHVVGFWSGVIAFTATVSYVVVQVLQVARLITFPVDEILIYSTSLCIVIPFTLEILALHYITPVPKQFWSHAALLFTIIYATFVTANYVVQLATVIPAKLHGTVSDVSVLAQTPHSMFWNFDAIGYISMGLTTLLAIPLFNRTRQKWLRLSCIANALVTPLIGIVYFYPGYSEKLLLLGLPWGLTAPLFMLLLAIFIRKSTARHSGQQFNNENK